MLKAYLNSKKHTALMWFSKWEQHRDQSAAVNAAMSIGRYVGGLEYAQALIESDDPSAPTIRAELDAALTMWDQLTNT